MHASEGKLVDVTDVVETQREEYTETASEYRGVLRTLLRKGMPAAVCTIYDPRYPEPVRRRVGTAALCIINDAIIREAAWLASQSLISVPYAARTPISPTRSSLPFRAAAR